MSQPPTKGIASSTSLCIPVSHLESQVAEPEYGGENGEYAVDVVGGDLDDLEGEPQRVELGLVVHALQPDATRLVEVVELAGATMQYQAVGELFVPLQNLVIDSTHSTHDKKVGSGKGEDKLLVVYHNLPSPPP